MSEKLRKCPFCQSDDVSVESPYGCGLFRVECGNCNATGPSYDTRKKYGKDWPRDAAIRAWNGNVYIEVE
jgi:hypothetical protein